MPDVTPTPPPSTPSEADRLYEIVAKEYSIDTFRSGSMQDFYQHVLLLQARLSQSEAARVAWSDVAYGFYEAGKKNEKPEHRMSRAQFQVAFTQRKPPALSSRAEAT